MKDLFGDDPPAPPAPRRPNGRADREVRRAQVEAPKPPPEAPKPAPAAPPPPPERPRRVSALRNGEAAVEGAKQEAQSTSHLPCTTAWRSNMVGSHRCKIGGGVGTASQDGGRSWSCFAHVHPSYWPKNRAKEP